jgi:hypothetical protein
MLMLMMLCSNFSGSNTRGVTGHDDVDDAVAFGVLSYLQTFGVADI